jgi:hypothetical protein
MTDTTQTTVAASTGPAAAAGTAPAPTGETTTSAALKGSVLVGEAKPEGKDQGQTSGENNTTPADGAEIEVKLPDGVAVDQKMLDTFKPVFKEVGLNSEQASRLATKYVEIAAAAQKEQMSSWEKQSESWEGLLKSDADFGGAKFSESVAKAQAAVLKFGGPELVADLSKYGIGNLPTLARAFAKIGRAIAEDDSSVKGKPDGQVGLSEADKLKLRYNKSQ